MWRALMRRLLMVGAVLLLAPPVPATAQQQSLSNGIFTAEEWRTAESGVPLARRVIEERGVAQVEIAAARGDGEALYLLGIAKWVSLAGVPVNLPEARALLRRSVMSGFSRSTIAYSSMLFSGLGGEQNREEALSWLEAGASAGQVSALISLGDYYRHNATPPDVPKAREYYERAAAEGSWAGRAALAELSYLELRQGEDPAPVVTLYRQAAEAGSSRGMVGYATALEYGLGIERDLPAALQWYVRAAQLDHCCAAVSAARMMLEGRGGPADPAGAAQLLNTAVDRGNYEAIAMLSKLLVSRTVPPIPGRDAEQLAVIADEHGYPDGLGSLVVSLREGRNGYTRDLPRAATLARGALARAEARSLDTEGGWPMHAKGAAYTIQVALAESAIPPATPDEAEALARRYGPHTSRLLRFEIPITCGPTNTPSPFHIYIWNATQGPSPAAMQFDWVEARGCRVPRETREIYDRLFERALATGRLYTDLTLENAHGTAAPVVGAIEF